MQTAICSAYVPMPDADAIAADPHAAAAIARAERRLEILAELTEIGMDLARDVSREAAPADAFARLSRAIRLTLSLEARTDAELALLRAGVMVEIETRREAVARNARAAAERASADHREAIERAVREAVEVEIDDPQNRCFRIRTMEDRLQYEEAYADLDAMTLTEAVQRLCADLGLNPDWSRWSDAGWDWEPSRLAIPPP
jgi:hypothetical protein